MHKHAWLAISVVSLSMACSADVAGGAKGAEDDPPVDGKADSFRRPTEHGRLSWGIESRAELSADALYHSWTFTTSTEASFALETGGNLDTVLYLYHRDSAEAGWGRYVAKNDDAAPDTATSRIELADAPAGEYRVIVKGYKTNYRGPFSVRGTCDGRGCDGGGECDGTFPAWESGSGYSAACDAQLLAVLGSPVRTVMDTRQVEPELVCNLSSLEERTVELYQGYWDSVYGWDEHTGGEPVTFEVSSREHEAGAVVRAGAYGFDEDSIVALYDRDGALVMFWNDGQSVDEQWSCAVSGEEADAYGPSCTTDLFRALPHAASDATPASGTTTPDTALGDLGDFLGMAMSEYAYAFGIGDATPVEYEGETWRTEDGTHGGRVTFNADGIAATYTLITTWDDHTLLAATETETETKIGCVELM